MIATGDDEGFERSDDSDADSGDDDQKLGETGPRRPVRAKDNIGDDDEESSSATPDASSSSSGSSSGSSANSAARKRASGMQWGRACVLCVCLYVVFAVCLFVAPGITWLTPPPPLPF